jgi:hypothetical protein
MLVLCAHLCLSRQSDLLQSMIRMALDLSSSLHHHTSGERYGSIAVLLPLPPRVYTLALVLSARDIGDTSQGHISIDESPEIGTRGLYLCYVGLAARESNLTCLAIGVAATT